MNQIRRYNDYVPNEELTKTVIAVIALHEGYQSRSETNTADPSPKSKKPNKIFGKLKSDIGGEGGRFFGGLVNQFKKGGSDFFKNMLTKYAPGAWQKISSRVLTKDELKQVIIVFQTLINKMDNDDKKDFDNELKKMAGVLNKAAHQVNLKSAVKI